MDEALRELKKISALRDIITKDDVRKAVLDLAKKIPKDCSFRYGSKDMIPYREQIDSVVSKLLMYNRTARKADLRFYIALGMLQNKVNGVINGNGEDTNHYKIDPKNITLIEEIENDYKRRQGNLLLKTVKHIKAESFETRFKHKVNDKSLKRRLAISHRKVGKLFDSFLSSFGSDSGCWNEILLTVCRKSKKKCRKNVKRRNRRTLNCRSRAANGVGGNNNVENRINRINILYRRC